MAKIAERVRRLLALANSPNVHEAAAAAAEAQRLMQEHKLTAAEVEAGDGSKITELPLGADGFLASWKFALVTGVARAFFCEAIAMRTGRTRRVRIVGKKDDAEVAVHVFEYLVKEIDRLADVDADTFEARYFMNESKVDVRAYKEKFRQGAAQGVADKLKEETEKFTNSDSKALVVVASSRTELRDYLKSKYGASRVVDPEKPKTDAEAEAFVRGYEKGQNVAIPRVGGAEKYITGEVRLPPAPDAYENIYFYGSHSYDSFYDDFFHGSERESQHRASEDFSREQTLRRPIGVACPREPDGALCYLPDCVAGRPACTRDDGSEDLSRGRGGRSLYDPFHGEPKKED